MDVGAGARREEVNRVSGLSLSLLYTGLTVLRRYLSPTRAGICRQGCAVHPRCRCGLCGRTATRCTASLSCTWAAPCPLSRRLWCSSSSPVCYCFVFVVCYIWRDVCGGAAVRFLTSQPSSSCLMTDLPASRCLSLALALPQPPASSPPLRLPLSISALAAAAPPHSPVFRALGLASVCLRSAPQLSPCVLPPHRL